MTSIKESKDMVEYVDSSLMESNADVYVQEVDCNGSFSSDEDNEIKKKYPDIVDLYRYKSKAIRSGKGSIGDAQIISCEDGKYVCNLFAEGCSGINYEALYSSLKTVAKYFENKTIAIPYNMGCADGNGKWELVSMLIEKIFEDGTNKVLICSQVE